MSYNDEHKYDDIINLPHHVSKKHPQMSLLDRASQFSPFAALTGHGDAVAEIERLTDERIELDENTLEKLDLKLQVLRDGLKEKPIIEFTYFVPDERKQGGSYEKVVGTIKKIDMYEHSVVMDNGIRISINDLVSIEGDFFKGLEEY